MHLPLRRATLTVGLFNEVMLHVDGNHVEHWSEGRGIQAAGPLLKELVAKSKFRRMPHYGMMSKGHIDLQYNRDEVWYRNIKIRPRKCE